MSQKFLSHFGIPGMRWGVQRAENTIIRTEKSFKREAKNLRANADMVGAYAYLRTNSEGKVNGSLVKKLKVSNAQARANAFREQAIRQDNIARGVVKAKKLVSGMNMHQSIKTLQKAAGYTDEEIFVANLLSANTRLSRAAKDYAIATTNKGQIDIRGRKGE
jgi:hypothetical protein